MVCVISLFGCTNKETIQIEDKPNQEQTVDGDESFNGSLKELMGMGKKVECSWQTNDEEGNASEGKVYVDGNRSKSEIRVKGEEEMVIMSLTDGKMGYMWNDINRTGSKYDIAEMEKMGQEMERDIPEETAETDNIDTNWEEKMNYVCKPWKVDEAVFAIPTDIVFADLGAQLKQSQEMMEGMKESLAGVCDSLPEPQKSQCLESMESEE